MLKTLLICYCAFCYGVCIMAFIEWFKVAPYYYNLYHWCTNVYWDLTIKILQVIFAPIYLPLKLIYVLLKPFMEK